MTLKHYDYDILSDLEYDYNKLTSQEKKFIKLYLINTEGMKVGVQYTIKENGMDAQIGIKTLDQIFLIDEQDLTIGECNTYERAWPTVKANIQLCLPDKHTLNFSAKTCVKVPIAGKWHCISNSGTVSV